MAVASGVPQGSVFGQLLFITYRYINDVAIHVSQTTVNMFADDIELYRVIKTTADYTHLQQHINSISTCIQQKYLTLIRTNAT